MKKKKILLICTVLLLLAALAAGLVFREEIYRFFNPIRNDWYVDEDTGYRYYLDGESQPLTGWQVLDGKRYYLDPDLEGAVYYGWLEQDGKKYYLNDLGCTFYGWQEVDGAKRYFDKDGALHKGWLELDEGVYYLSGEGTALTGWLELDEGRFYLSDAGLKQTGWLELDEITYYLDEKGNPWVGWLELDGSGYYLNEEGVLQTGWLDLPEGRFYLDEAGVRQTGWLELEEGRYYMGSDGTMCTGWLELEDKLYYLLEDGTPAVGKKIIEEETYYFTSTGANIILVNRWNEVPEGYTTELTKLPNGREISTVCYDALMKMVEDCTAAGGSPNIIGANRTNAAQRSLFNSRIQEYVDKGMSRSYAYYLTLEGVAVPGTSEHELGLAVDIVDPRYPQKYTGEDNAVAWLSEHCWEYGFILRYLPEAKDITGIKSEPWHFRYVGVELAMELKELGICLEEYLDLLTNDGTTCGNPEILEKEEEQTQDKAA